MKSFSSLFAKILIWLFINLAIIGVVLAIFFTFQFQMNLNSIFGRQTSDRMRVAGRLISYDLSQTLRENWSKVLTRHSMIHQVNFALVLGDGTRFLSNGMDMPESVMKSILNTFQPQPQLGQFPPRPLPGPDKGINGMHPPDALTFNDQEVRGDKLPGQDDPPDQKPRVMMRTKNPTKYWARIPVSLSMGQSFPGPPPILLAVSDSITGNGFFFDPLPWIIIVVAVLLISVLFWIPLVRNITRPLARMTHAAEEITKGNFDVRINEPRIDEIGRLGSAINQMTSRLSAYVNGQKRFLGDVAHELGSPIARIQFGLGILEQRADKDTKERVDDVIEDVTHMSNLINELLSFSRAEINPSRVKLVDTELDPIIKLVIQRENVSSTEIISEIEANSSIKADPELLTRALANILRNAVRYAGEAGSITIKARKEREHVVIEVLDSGPGVPDDRLDQLFEPFYRLEPSRDPDLGGVGLGLAIVKTCIEACKGTVSARNLEGGGFVVTITLMT